MFEDLFSVPLREAQERINKKYVKEGCLTDAVLNEQVKINQIRNILNIHDETEEIYEEYVQ